MSDLELIFEMEVQVGDRVSTSQKAARTTSVRTVSSNWHLFQLIFIPVSRPRPTKLNCTRVCLVYHLTHMLPKLWFIFGTHIYLQ